MEASLSKALSEKLARVVRKAISRPALLIYELNKKTDKYIHLLEILNGKQKTES